MLEFGLAHPGSYMTSKQEGLKDHSKHYPSSNYNDEMAWGALWLHLATEVSLPLPGTPGHLHAQAGRDTSRQSLFSWPLVALECAVLRLHAVGMPVFLSLWPLEAAWGLTASSSASVTSMGSFL